jgi:hypothetical protein
VRDCETDGTQTLRIPERNVPEATIGDSGSSQQNIADACILDGTGARNIGIGTNKGLVVGRGNKRP